MNEWEKEKEASNRKKLTATIHIQNNVMEGTKYIDIGYET